MQGWSLGLVYLVLTERVIGLDGTMGDLMEGTYSLAHLGLWGGSVPLLGDARSANVRRPHVALRSLRSVGP